MAIGSVAVVLMARFPEPGKVKTRLQALLTAEQAAEVHRVFLRHVFRRLERLQPQALVMCVDPPEALEAMRRMLGGALRLLGQSRGDLGQRMAAAAAELRQRHARLLFLGVDSPDVPPDALQEAADKLAVADVVVGPTPDGGYWCLGVGPQVDATALLAHIAWSSGREYQQTLQRTGELGYQTAIAPAWDDVDHPSDLCRLLRRLEHSCDCDDKGLLQALRFLPAGAGP